jgi:hypothetical protein
MPIAGREAPLCAMKRGGPTRDLLHAADNWVLSDRHFRPCPALCDA